MALSILLTPNIKLDHSEALIQLPSNYLITEQQALLLIYTVERT